MLIHREQRDLAVDVGSGTDIGYAVGARCAVRNSRIYSAISCLLRRNNSISDGVSIDGAREVASLRLSKAVEAVTESVLPPVFEVSSMSCSQCG